MEFDMTTQRDLKQIIRARMEKTGESYVTARRQILATPDAPALHESLDANETATIMPKWHPLIETTETEARNLLAIALEQEPRLTHFGMGIGGEMRRRSKGESLEAELFRQRQALFDHLDEIAACADWIKRQKKIKTFNTSRTSYGYKHAVERWFRLRGGPHLYASNGSFIAAAIGLGFAARLADPFSPNVHFQFSKRALKAIEAV